MAAFGGQYPGACQPTWWTNNSSATTSASLYVYQTASPSPRSEPKAKDKGNIGWLRERVQEICSLAEFGAV